MIGLFKQRIILIGLGILLLFSACGPTSDSQAPEAQSVTATSSSFTPSAQAASHIGERATVCGPVIGTRYATGSKGQPTFLNFDRAYPNHTFVVVIWGSDRSNFPPKPERHYMSKDVCATGLIEMYSGKAEIVTSDSSQLQIQR